jgi:hypothetical protein
MWANINGKNDIYLNLQINKLKRQNQLQKNYYVHKK